MFPGRVGGIRNVSCSKRLAEPVSHPLGDGHLKMAGSIATIAAGPTDDLPLPGRVCRSDYLLVAPDRRNEMPSTPKVLPNKIPLAHTPAPDATHEHELAVSRRESVAAANDVSGLLDQNNIDAPTPAVQSGLALLRLRSKKLSSWKRLVTSHVKPAPTSA